MIFRCFFSVGGCIYLFLIVRRLKLPIGYQILLLTLLSNSVLAQDKLPSFTFPDAEGKTLTNENFRNGRSLILFYYEPTCSHCQQQAEWVAAIMDQFNEVDLLWVAWEPTDQIENFRSQYFPQAENAYYVIDVDGVFDQLFGFSQIPTIFVYSSNDELIKKFKKETKAEKLLKLINDI